MACWRASSSESAQITIALPMGVYAIQVSRREVVVMMGLCVTSFLVAGILDLQQCVVDLSDEHFGERLHLT